MLRFTSILVLSIAVAGCVVVSHDAMIPTLKPADVELRAFAGTYKERAVYYTDSRGSAFSTFGMAIGSDDFGSNVVIEFDAADKLVARAARPRWLKVEPFSAEKEKEYVFVDHCIRFLRDNRFAPGPGGVAVGRESMYWMLDDQNRLVVVSGWRGGGFLTVVPVFSSVTRVAIFERVQEAANQALVPTVTSVTPAADAPVAPAAPAAHL